MNEQPFSQEEFSSQLVQLQVEVSSLRHALGEARSQLRADDPGVQPNIHLITPPVDPSKSTNGYRRMRTFTDAPSVRTEKRLRAVSNDDADPFFRSPRMYYSRHFLFRFFDEVSYHESPCSKVLMSYSCQICGRS